MVHLAIFELSSINLYFKLTSLELALVKYLDYTQYTLI